MSPPFRADHVGSLLRPPELLAAREQHRAGTLTAGQLKALEDAAILEVVRRQENIGLRSVTDGEFRRTLWHIDFLKQFTNVESTRSPVKVSFHTDHGDTERAPSALRVTGKLARPHPIFVEHFRYLNSVARAMPKLTIPSPSILHFRGGRDVIDR
jgi:5-methyltetrahydropteroyltriglutamate--homocysteine methyltransferase